MPACEMRPEDKKAFIGAVGKDLVRSHGKQKYYKPEDIGRSAARSGFDIDVTCWAYCFYATPADFKALHDAAGEVCDYVAMKSELLTDLASGATFSLRDLDLSWLEWPDIDLPDIFDWFDI